MDSDAGTWFLSRAERGNLATDVHAGGAGSPSWSQGNLVRPLIHGVTYFERLHEELSALQAGDRVWFTDWRGDADDLRDLYRVLVPSPHIRSVHVFHNLQVRIEGNEALYTAIFQRWTAGSRPICLDIGYFSGCMTAGPQVWYWTRHSITSAATGRRDGISRQSAARALP